MRVGFIGGGVMAEAMISGILARGVARTGDILASDVIPERRAFLSQKYGIQIAEENRAVLGNADIVVLAVKPQTLSAVFRDLKGQAQPSQTYLSIVAGATIDTLARGLEHAAIIRAMPNTPAQIGEGISAWTATPAVDAERLKQAKAILEALGDEVYFQDEKYLNMVTALSGSGPAYVFLFIEALIDAGVLIGLPRDMSRRLALQTVQGSARFMAKTGKHPGELRDMVSSPGGTTVEALLKLEEGKFRATIEKAVAAAYEKAVRLGERDKKL
ncbi:MAG: pyrroline-5-carboxylate reductase [Dehalococcoidia bacterium]|nr:pyrroline-5-carboxylate reductase [Dehalococcoidia bacterium]